MESTPITTLILTSIDIDCDGIGQSWQRIIVPEALGRAVHASKQRYAEHASTVRLNQTRALALLRDAPAWSDEVEAELQPLNEARERAYTRQCQEAHVVHRLTELVLDYARDTEQRPLDDAVVLAEEDEAHFLAELYGGGGFDWDYYKEEGYYHEFSAR